MVNVRYNLSKRDFKREQEKIKERIKRKFRQIANESNINLMDLDTINVSSETLYNPYKYSSHNKWVRKF